MKKEYPLEGGGAVGTASPSDDPKTVGGHSKLYVKPLLSGVLSPNGQWGVVGEISKVEIAPATPPPVGPIEHVVEVESTPEIKAFVDSFFLPGVYAVVQPETGIRIGTAMRVAETGKLVYTWISQEQYEAELMEWKPSHGKGAEGDLGDLGDLGVGEK